MVWAKILAGLCAAGAIDVGAENAPQDVAYTIRLSPNIRVLDNGDLANFDGEHYDYRAADGGRQFRVWVPPGNRVVRGLIVSGHGGGSGDSRPFTRDMNLRALAARYDFGLVGLHRFPGREMSAAGGRFLVDALARLAQIGPHPELANVPFAAFGSSNGGATAYGLAAGFPERTLLFVSNVMTRLTPPLTDPAAHRVPGVLIIGAFDRLMGGEASVPPFAEAFSQARQAGAVWSLVVEAKGHEDGSAFDVFVGLMDRILPLRYPTTENPRTGPVRLRPIDASRGWIGQAEPRTDAQPSARFLAGEPDSRTGSWLPDGLARVWMGAATFNNRLTVRVRNAARAVNPNVDPRTMFSIGAPVVDPGEALEIQVGVDDLGAWSSIEVFDGDERIGALAPEGDGSLRYVPPAGRRVVLVTAKANLVAGGEAMSAPVYLAVRDPNRPLLPTAADPRPFVDAVGPVGSRSSLGQTFASPAAPDPAVLVSYGLTAEQERTFAQGLGPSAFWSRFNDRHSTIRMSGETHARQGSSFSIVNTVDARLLVRAAHSARGLYLWMEVVDNEFVEPSPAPTEYNNRDAVDVLIDRKSSAWINNPANVRWAVNLDWGLWLTTKQIQIAVGGRGAPGVLKLQQADPFEIVFDRFVSRDDARRLRGIVVRHHRLDPLTRAVELFLPWSEVGGHGGLLGEPAFGTRMAFSPSYNDVDGSESRKALAWVGGRSPWDFSAQRGEAPRGWGDLEIGPMLGP